MDEFSLDPKKNYETMIAKQVKKITNHYQNQLYTQQLRRDGSSTTLRNRSAKQSNHYYKDI